MQREFVHQNHFFDEGIVRESGSGAESLRESPLALLEIDEHRIILDIRGKSGIHRAALSPLQHSKEVQLKMNSYYVSMYFVHDECTIL